MVQDPPRRPALRRVAAALVGLVAALLATEVLFRVAGLGRPEAPKCMLGHEVDRSVFWHCYPSNPDGEFVPTPDVSRGGFKLARVMAEPVVATPEELAGTPWCVEYRRPMPAARGPVFPQMPMPGVVRFLAVGDSFTLGEGVPEEKTLPARLPGLLGPPVEVVNLGESGADIELNLQRLEWGCSTYGASRALVVHTLNDVGLTPETRRLLEGAYDLINLRTAALGPVADRPWWRFSRTASFFVEASAVRDLAGATIQAYRDAYDPAKNAQNLALLGSHFRRMASYRDVKVGLVVYPLMHKLDDYPLQACHDQVMRLAREAGLPALDLAPAFRGQDAAKLHVHPIDHHPNGRAHEIAARAVAEFVRREPKLRW